MALINPYFQAASLEMLRHQNQVTNQDVDSYFGVGGEANQGRSGRSFGGQPNIAGGIAGVAGLAGSVIGMENESLGLGAAPPQQEVSATGQPIYNAGQFHNDAYLSKPQGAQAGEVINMGLQGAQAGMSFGGPIGAGIGAVVGVGAGLIGGKRRKERQIAERNDALAQATKAQQGFNEASSSFNQQQLAAQDYMNRVNNSSRLYNLYRS